MRTAKTVSWSRRSPTYDGEQHQVMLADGRAVPIERQTCLPTAIIMTPWAPVTFWLALAVMPGEDNLLILWSKMLREELSIGVMKQPRDTAAALGGDASSTKHAPAEVPAVLPEIVGVRLVAVMMEAIQVVEIEVEAAGETDGSRTLLDRKPNVMMRFGDSEMEEREQVLEDAILTAARAGMPPDDLAELRTLVLGPYKEVFCQGLTGESPARVGLGSLQVRSMAAYVCPDADYSLLSKSATKDKKLELVELVGGRTSVRTTFDSDSVNVIESDLTNAEREGAKKL